MPKYQDVNVGESIRVWSADGKLLATVAAVDLILPKTPSNPPQHMPELRDRLMDVQCGICGVMVASDLFSNHALAHGEGTAG